VLACPIPGGCSLIALAALSLLLQSSTPDASTPAAPAALRDQFGRVDSLAAHGGAPLVAMVVTARRLRALKGWEIDLRRRFEGLTFLRVVEVPAQPPVTFEDVARKLRDRVPREVPILVDLDRTWAAAYGLDDGEVNLLIFDARGRLVSRFRVERNAASLAVVAHVLAPLVSATRGVAR
jgi:hypothetical protein